MPTPTVTDTVQPDFPPPAPHRAASGLLDPQQLLRSLPDALRKLDPRTLYRNPVMFIVEIGAVFSTVLTSNVLAMSGRAVEAAGDVNTLLLDKTGTITIGNREAKQFLPVGGVTEDDLANAAQLSSLADETPEGRSIVVHAKERYGLRERRAGELTHLSFVPFTAQTRMSGVDLTDGDGSGLQVRKGATSSVVTWVREHGGTVPNETGELVDGIAASGGTPLLVAESRDGTARVLGVVALRDVVKRHAGAFRRAAGDGHPDRDDHRVTTR